MLTINISVVKSLRIIVSSFYCSCLSGAAEFLHPNGPSPSLDTFNAFHNAKEI